MSSDEFGSAVRARLKEMGRSQEWLGAEIARITGRAKPYSQNAVSAWITGDNQAPVQVVFAAGLRLADPVREPAGVPHHPRGDHGVGPRVKR